MTTRERLIELVAACPGITQAEAARQLGVSKSRIWQLREKNNLPMPHGPPKAPPPRPGPQDIVALIRERPELLQSEIVSRLGVSYFAVYRALVDHLTKNE